MLIHRVVSAVMIETYEAAGAWLSKNREEGWDPSQVEALSRMLAAQ